MRDVCLGAMEAAYKAHSQQGEVPCLKLFYDPNGAAAIGGLFAFFQTVCAVSAKLLEVHLQPTREAYKKNLVDIFRIDQSPNTSSL